MATEHPEPLGSSWIQGLILAGQPASGTKDDDDDRDDEHAGENEPPVRETDENTETPEEFEVDDEDELGHPEDDDADEDVVAEER